MISETQRSEEHGAQIKYRTKSFNLEKCTMIVPLARMEPNLHYYPSETFSLRLWRLHFCALNDFCKTDLRRAWCANKVLQESSNFQKFYMKNHCLESKWTLQAK